MAINTQGFTIDDFERDVAQFLLSKLDNQSITFERASQIAQFVLNNLPSTLTIAQFRVLLPKLDDKFIELTEIVNMYIEEYTKNSKIEDIRILLQSEKMQVAGQQIQEYLKGKTHV